jgi:hypothetical protein
MIKRRSLVEKFAKKMKYTPRGLVRAHYSTVCIANAINTSNSGLTVSSSTVRRDLKTLGFKSRKRQYVSKHLPTDPRDRLARCRVFLKMTRDQLQRIHFTDEKTFNINDHGCVTQWVKDGEPLDKLYNNVWAPKIKVWGVIGHHFKFLVFLPEGTKRMNSNLYMDLCLKPYIAFLRKNRVNPILQYDGDSSHDSLASLNYLAEKGVELLPGWPARSCDLSPIENMWAIVQYRVDTNGPVSYEDLKKFIQKEWDAIPMETVNNLCESFHGRLRRCVAGEGLPIQTKGC